MTVDGQVALGGRRLVTPPGDKRELLDRVRIALPAVLDPAAMQRLRDRSA